MHCFKIYPVIMDDHGQSALTGHIKTLPPSKDPRKLCFLSCLNTPYYVNESKFLILQLQPLPEQGNSHHRVSVTQVHEDLKEQTESERHRKAPRQVTGNLKHLF